MEEWKKCKLGEFANIIMGQSPESSYYNANKEGIPFLQGNRTFGFKYPTFDTYTTFITKEAKKDDVIMSVRAPVGDLNIAPERLCLGRGVCSIRALNGEQLFLYYLMKANQKQLLNKENGTVFGSVNRNDISNLIVKIPPLPTQQKIAAILSSLDDKIELNNNINENLEQQAQALFKNWFVDFEPFGDKMPEGWKVGNLSDLGTIVGGSTPSKAKSEYYTENGISWITPKDLSNDKSKFISHGEIDITELGFENSSAIKMPAGTVLYSSRAPIGYIAIAKNEVTTNQGFKSVIPNENIGNGYIYYFLKTNYELIDSLASGSTFKEISGSAMKNVPALIPDDKTLKSFQNFCNSIFEEQEKLEEENKTLATIRDTLLPRLMNGEIEV